MSAQITGVVSNIQHFSVHDGPGIRTAVFLKGCPLRCRWCANPETQRFAPEPAWTRSKCIGCGGCVQAFGCKFTEAGMIFGADFAFDAAQVDRVCPGGALHMIGSEMTAQEVVDRCERDRAFFGEDGGITVTGGEPLAQIDFTLAILDEAKKRGIGTAIESCGFAPVESAIAAAERCDTYITDIKCVDEALHTANTGASNRRILENLREITARFPEKPILVRTPVIPGFNDTDREITRIAEYLAGLKSDSLTWELLRYHRLGLPKYESLAREYPMGDAELPAEQFSALQALAKTKFKNTV